MPRSTPAGKRVSWAKPAVFAMAMIVGAAPAWACSPEPWSADPCRRADLPSCYYDWTSANGERLGTCTSVLGRCEAQFTAILNSARSESDAAKRKQYYQDAQKLLVDTSGSIVPFFADRTTGLSKKVLNYKEYGFEFDYLHIGFKA